MTSLFRPTSSNHTLYSQYFNVSAEPALRALTPESAAPFRFAELYSEFQAKPTVPYLLRTKMQIKYQLAEHSGTFSSQIFGVCHVNLQGNDMSILCLQLVA